MFFEVSGGRKSIKKSIKIASWNGLELRRQNNTQKCSKMAPTWLQNGTKLELSWAPKSFGPVLGPPKSEDKTETENDTEKAHPKTPQQKIRHRPLPSNRPPSPPPDLPLCS